MRNQNTEARIQKTEYKRVENPALTPTLYPSGYKSLRARETKKGRTAFLPVMLSPGLRYLEGLSKHLLVLCSVFIITACGGGSSEGSSPTTASSTITFSGSSSGYNVYMAQNTSQSSGSVLAVDIMVSDVSNVYGTAFDVDFDSSKMTYSSYSAGSFLESGGNSVTYQAALQSDNSGKLIVVASRQGSVAGATGSGTVVTLKFNVTSGGSVSFSNSSLVDSSGNTISSASWSSGGTVSVL